MRALKWITGVLVISAIVALMCFALTGFTIAGREWEGMLFLFILVAFIGVVSSVTLLLMIVPHTLLARVHQRRPLYKSNSGYADPHTTLPLTRRRWVRVAGAISLLIGFSLWAVYSLVVYDACLDRIHYDRSHWHECD